MAENRSFSGFGWEGGAGGLLNDPKRWGVSPPTSSDGFKTPRGRRDPEDDRFSAKSKVPLC